MTNINIDLAKKLDGSKTHMTAIFVDSWGDKLVVHLTVKHTHLLQTILLLMHTTVTQFLSVISKTDLIAMTAVMLSLRAPCSIWY